MKHHNIVITNDDGIGSPGLKAAVGAASSLGTVTVVAPSKQQSGAGRSLFGDRQSYLMPIDYGVNGTAVRAYHCNCSPALVVRHSLRTIFKDTIPDLLIAGINYGENLGTDITSSGTVGAALEAASLGVPSIAISKQTDIDSHHAHTHQDWSASEYFLQKFSKLLLEKKSHPDVQVLKIDVPSDATPSTAWKMTRLAKAPYYLKDIEKPSARTKLSHGKTIIQIDATTLDSETDIHAIAIDRMVSVTPLSLDLSSRVALSDLKASFEPYLPS